MSISRVTISLLGVMLLCASCTDQKTPTQTPARMDASPAKSLSWEDALRRLQLGLTVKEFKDSISALHNALDSKMRVPPPHHLYTYGSSTTPKTVFLFRVASGQPLYYALFEDDALATVFRETRELANIRLAAESALESNLLISLAQMESEIGNQSKTFPQEELERDARSHLRTRALRDKHLEPSPLLEGFPDDTANSYNESRRLIDEYDGASVRIGVSAQEVLDSFAEQITSFRVADRNVTVFGEAASTGWFPNPRVVIVANDDNKVTRVFTFYVREH